MSGQAEHRGVKVFADYVADVRDVADFVVVGSGPGGAVVAKELAEKGHDVILVEEGPPFGVKDFVQEPGASMRRTLREAGMRAARGKAMFPTMQAIGLGGGSLVNSAICVRPPAWVFDRWAERFGVDFSLDAMMPHFERVEEFMGIGPTPEDVLGERNLLFKRGCDALGIHSEPCWRNVKGCKGSSECFTGCRHRAKQSTDISYVPAAIAAGARVYTSVRAESVIFEGRRATGIEGRVVEPMSNRETGQASLHARKAVVLAAGCIATPQILMRSKGGAGPSGQVGKNLQFHPGSALMGLWSHDVDPWFGATQGHHSLQFLEEGMKLEVLWAPPALLATRFPGFGHEFKSQLSRLKHMAPFDVIIGATKSTGYLKLRGSSWDPDIRYDVHPEDEKTFHRGMILLADIMWAAGAKSIITGLHGLPPEITKDQHHLLTDMEFTSAKATVSCNHVFGTTRMGKDPKNSVTDDRGRCHHTDNLYISDTGIIPISPAVNPMHTLMAMADRIAGQIHDAH